VGAGVVGAGGAAVGGRRGGRRGWSVVRAAAGGGGVRRLGLLGRVGCGGVGLRVAGAGRLAAAAGVCAAVVCRVWCCCWWAACERFCLSDVRPGVVARWAFGAQGWVVEVLGGWGVVGWPGLMAGRGLWRGGLRGSGLENGLRDGPGVRIGRAGGPMGLGESVWRGWDRPWGWTEVVRFGETRVARSVASIRRNRNRIWGQEGRGAWEGKNLKGAWVKKS